MEEMSHRLSRDSLQTFTILPETIMKEVVLRNNRGFLVKHCPLLKNTEIDEIIEQVCDYYHDLVLFQLCSEAGELAEALEQNPQDSALQNKLCELLHYEFLYDPREYPEISYFKVLNGKLPRKEQVEIYKWVCEGLAKGENRLFQHKAGGGKTDYLTPLFMLRAKRLGLTPVFISTPLIYSIDRDNLSYTMKTLDDQLGYLEIGLHTKLREEDLKFIYEQLVQYHDQGRGMILTPQTYYALRLQYFYAGIKEGSKEKVRWLALILDHFETKCLALGDEAHRNYDPLTRAIYGVGSFFQLPKEESALFLEMLKPLLGFEKVICENGAALSDLSRMAKNLVGSPSQKEIILLQKALAEFMSCSIKLNIPEEERPSLIHYWTSKTAPQPKFLVSLAAANTRQADLIALTGYFILDLLPQLVNMRTELDHAPSIYPEEEFDTPCHHKTPSTAQYEDPYLSASVSVKGTSHRGLSEIQIRRMLEKLLEKDWKEQTETHASETESSSLFAALVRNTEFEQYHLRDISLSSPAQMAQINDVLAKRPIVIDYYLTQFILPQIGYCLQQFSATPAHLLNGFALSVLFSATPQSKLMYPGAIGEVRYDPEFEAEVVHEFCLQKNQKKVVVESPETFFMEIQGEEGAQLFGDTQVFIDPAGFFSDFRNEDVAKNWLAASKELDGVLFFKEGRSLKVDKGEKVCLILRSNPNKITELEGSNIREALLHLGLKWEDLRIGTYYDASHCESADILQKAGTNALIFMADNLTSSRLIQGLMRLRGLLDAHMIQSIAWVYPQGLLSKIPPSSTGEIDGPAIFAWTAGKEGGQMKKRVVLSAFQEIAFLIEQAAMRELKECLHEPERQIEIMLRHQKGLLEESKHAPYSVFAEHESDEKTKKVLFTYANSYYRRFAFDCPLAVQETLLTQIERVIEETQERIQSISTNWGRKLSMEVEHHTRLKKETEQENYRPRPFDPISAEGIYGSLAITDPEYPYSMKLTSTRRIFKAPELTPRLFLEINQLKTARDSGVALDENFLKPIDFFLILIPEGEKPFAVAHSNDILKETLKKLEEGTDNPLVKHKAFLVTADGKLLQRGKKQLQPPIEDVQTILTSQWMQDLVIDGALLRGQIAHPERLKERMQKWSGFQDFWSRIVRSQPNPESANRNGMLRLISEAVD